MGHMLFLLLYGSISGAFRILFYARGSNTFMQSALCVAMICIALQPAIAQQSVAQQSVAQQNVAQQTLDSVWLLEEVPVTDSRLALFASGDKVAPVTGYAIGNMDYTNLSELLMKYSAINVRSYGVGGLSTASLRGTGSNHTAVFWEGINLQSSMNGSLDLTLMPVSFIDDISLQYGSAGSLFGSGAMGGAIHLASQGLSENDGWQGRLYQQLGSFGSTYTGLNVGVREGKFAVKVRGFASQADNDFPFFNIYKNRRETRQNAAIRQHGLLAETYLSLNSRHDLSLKYWFQDNLVHIPSVVAAGGKARATQADVFHRAILQWQWQERNNILKAHTALVYHNLVYDDKMREPSLSQSTSWITEVGNTHYLNDKNWLYAGLNHTYETATVDSYGANRPQRNRTALYLSYRTLLIRKLEGTLGMRETLIDGKPSPFLPSLGLSYALTQQWHLKTKVARSYRVPTFNDLYWVGAGGLGNPDLQPEKGWSSEVGIQASDHTMGQVSISGEATIFSSSINQWIGWVPVTASEWSPINVEQVWARGVEVSGNMQYQFSRKLSAQVWGTYTYTKSTKEKINDGGSATELHKQLIYTPYHQFKASVNMYYQQWTVGYSHLFVGDQFATSSNQLTLPYYNIGDFSLTYQWKISHQHQLLLNGKLNNAFNKDYEVRRGYPMPGRNYHISIIYQFNQ